MLKEFQVVNGMETTMEITNQQVTVFELSEVIRKRIGNDERFLETYSVDISKTSKYIVSSNSRIYNYIVTNFQEGNFVKFDLSAFNKQYHGNEIVYFHHLVITKF